MSLHRIDTSNMSSTDFVDTMPVAPRKPYREPGYDDALMEGSAIPILFVIAATLIGGLGIVHLIARLAS